jgi:hypothetical protein
MLRSFGALLRTQNDREDGIERNSSAETARPQRLTMGKGARLLCAKRFVRCCSSMNWRQLLTITVHGEGAASGIRLSQWFVWRVEGVSTLFTGKEIELMVEAHDDAQSLY